MNCKKILQTTHLIIFLIIFFLVLAIDTSAMAQQGDKYLNYAMELLKKNQPEAAEVVLSAGIQQGRASLKLIYLRAKIRADYLKNFSGAFKDYSITIKHDGKSFPKAYWRRGDILASYGMLVDAIKDYSKCLQIMPKYGKVYFKRAEAYTRLGLREKAKSDLYKCLKYSPEYTKAVKQYMLKHQLF